MYLLLCILIIVCATMAIISRVLQNQRWFDLLKPLTTILIIVWAVMSMQDSSTIYGNWVISGLMLSLLGDILLLREKWFVPGLAAFLLAHLLFTLAFTSLFGFQWNMTICLVMTVIGMAYFIFLWPDLGSMIMPVGLYFVAIIMMNWQALSLIKVAEGSIYGWIGFSSVLFSFSDAVIAFDKFKRPFRGAEVLILSTYWISISILAFSVGAIG